MGEKYPRWTYVVIFALLAFVVVFAVRALTGRKTEGPGSAQPEKSAQASADRERRIQELDNQVAQLRKDVEANSNRIKELESKLDETRKALAASQQKLKVAQKTERPAAPSAAREKAVAKSVQSSPAYH